MFTPSFIRENLTKLGRGSIIDASDEAFDNVEIYSSQEVSMVTCIQTFASLGKTAPSEKVMIFPMINVKRIVIVSQD